MICDQTSITKNFSMQFALLCQVRSILGESTIGIESWTKLTGAKDPSILIETHNPSLRL